MGDYIDHGHGISTIAGLFTAEECQELIAVGERIGYVDAPITTAAGPVMAQDIRNNTRVIHDDHRLAAWMWERVRDWVDPWAGTAAIGLNERFRFYRYDPGQRFRRHRDGCFTRDNGETSRVTCMLYLNDGFEGGETSFPEVWIKPVAGLVLLFPHPILHAGQPVVSGRKYVLRTDVMYPALAVAGG